MTDKRMRLLAAAQQSVFCHDHDMTVMVSTVSVVTDNEVFGRGLALHLADHGITTAEAIRLDAASAPSAELIVATYARSYGDLLRKRLLEWQKPTVLLVEDVHPDEVLRLVRCGARAIVQISNLDDSLLQSLSLVANGCTVLPSNDVLEILRKGDHDIEITDHEISWIKLLDSGRTIYEVASAHGYSERSMYRLLSSVYLRIGVQDRRAATRELRARGILD